MLTNLLPIINPFISTGVTIDETLWQVLVVAAANFLLRFVTAKPIPAS